MDHLHGHRGLAATTRLLTRDDPSLLARRRQVCRHRLAELAAIVTLLVAAGLALGDTSSAVIP